MTPLSNEATLDLLDSHGVNTNEVAPAVAEVLGAAFARVAGANIDAFLALAPTDYSSSAGFGRELLDEFLSTFVATFDAPEEFARAWVRSPWGFLREGVVDRETIELYVDFGRVYADLTGPRSAYKVIGDGPVHVFLREGARPVLSVDADRGSTREAAAA